MLERGRKLGKYEILKPLGSGGFSTVYLASDTNIKKKFALKVPHRQDLDFGEQLQESRLHAKLKHVNVVEIFTAEKQKGVFFIVMEYVQGKTLEQLIATNGVVELEQALNYACQICEAVDHAHGQGVLHRDLRPGNVLISVRGRAKVADFGTSRYLDVAAHGTTLIGSPPYMAPEQFNGKAVFASDVYSLGITIYQMLTGMLPYEAPTLADLEKLMNGTLVTAPRLKNRNIPIRISDIVMRAMAPHIANRYQRVSHLLDALLAERQPASRSAGRRKRPASDADLTTESVATHTTPTLNLCPNCNKPLPTRARSIPKQCLFCGEKIKR